MSTAGRALPSCAPFRLIRTGVLAGSMLFLAFAAHSLAGGSLPPTLITLALLALVLLVTSVATLFRLSLPVVAAILGVGQLGLHQAFENFSAVGPVEGRIPAGHVHDFGAYLPTGGLPDAAGLAASPSFLMLLAHGVATGLMAVMVTRGEAALWALAAWLRPLFRLFGQLIPVPFTTPDAPAFSMPPLLPWRTLRRDRLRGPPRAALAF